MDPELEVYTMRTRTSKLMQRTHIRLARKNKQGMHYDNIWHSYLTRQDETTNIDFSTVSRHARGVTLPSWKRVQYYAGTGTRCPPAMEADLRDYIGRCYRSGKERAALRTALMQTLAELPEEDVEDIRAYWHEDDLANIWAVLQWYCICEDYAEKYWTVQDGGDDHA